VERNDNVWYDETAGMVIIAKTQEDALKFFLDEVNEWEFKYREKPMTLDRLSIRRIGITTEDYVYDVTNAVLRDFRAG
jgi:hypothetical protein